MTHRIYQYNPQFTFWHRLRVRWAEVDMQAIVFNGHYLTYFDVAFTEYWRATQLPSVIEQAAQGCELFARRSEIEYHAPARFDDELDIGVRCSKIGNSSMRFELEIWRSDEDENGNINSTHLISGALVYVYADAALRQAKPLPANWRAGLVGMENVIPEM